MTAVKTLAERKNKPALKSPKCCLRKPATVGKRNEITTLATLWRPKAEEKLSGKSSLKMLWIILMSLSIILKVKGLT